MLADHPELLDDSKTVPPYRLISEIGHGGMGTVYLAVRDDDSFRKRVAVKILKRGMDTDQIVRRFRNERQILASLDHPYIASLLDGGSTSEGRPYFVMEYVEGQPLVEYCETHTLDTTARLELFRRVCSAVHYAHQNLVVHRDIKPANVLVTADGTPKLLDFGIAKLLNPELGLHTFVPTLPGPQMMTPEYASPEQVRGETVTTASDVYSLGVLLYELLTGRRPYRLTSRTPAEIVRVVCGTEPPRPSTAVTQPALAEAEASDTGATLMTLVPSDHSSYPVRAPVDPERLRRRLSGDLDNIVMKALSKEPERRYSSADQFSDDVRRHLVGRPVIARKDTVRYRSMKFVRRNRTPVAAAVVVLLALVGGLVGTLWQARVAQREHARAEQRFDDVRQLANASLFELHDAIRDLPGSTEARKLLVSKGLEYLDKLSRDSGDRPDVARELAGAYVKVGDVQGRPLTPNLGDTAGALRSYRKAVGLYESLGAESGADPGMRRELATAYLRVSDVLGATGDTGGALGIARKALGLQRSVADTAAEAKAFGLQRSLADPAAEAKPFGLQRSLADPAAEAKALGLQRSVADPAADAGASRHERGRELAQTYSRVGDLLSATGDTNGALEHRRLSLAAMEAIIAEDPRSPDNRQQLGNSYRKLGNTLGNPNYPNVGDYEGALREIERCTEEFRRLSDDYPANATFRRSLAVTHSNASDVLLKLRGPHAALARQREALAVFEALAAADPANVAARNDVAISAFKVAELIDRAGSPAEAVPLYQRALDIHSSLAAGDRNNQDLQYQLAADYSALAALQGRIGQREAALRHHGRAVEISRTLQTGDAANVELRVALALALLERARTHTRFAGGTGSRPGPGGAPGRDHRDLAELDYAESVRLLTVLEGEGVLQGTDVETLRDARTELARVTRASALTSTR